MSQIQSKAYFKGYDDYSYGLPLDYSSIDSSLREDYIEGYNSAKVDYQEYLESVSPLTREQISDINNS